MVTPVDIRTQSQSYIVEDHARRSCSRPLGAATRAHILEENRHRDETRWWPARHEETLKRPNRPCIWEQNPPKAGDLTPRGFGRLLAKANDYVCTVWIRTPSSLLASTCPAGLIGSNRVRRISPLRLGSCGSLFVPRAGTYLAGKSLRDQRYAACHDCIKVMRLSRSPLPCQLWESDKDTI